MRLRDQTPVPAAISAPALLPGLAEAFSRRRVIFGAVAIAAAPVAVLPAVAIPEADPIVDMYRTAKDLLAVHNHPDTSIETADAAYDGVSEMRIAAFETAATTPAGALASLLWGREEFARYYIDEAETPDWLDRFTLKMIDNAIAVLQAEIRNV